MQIEFLGTGGAYYSVNLNFGSDMRDWLVGGYGDTINNTTTTNVFSNGSCRYDKQQFILPAAFNNQILTSIRLTDTGSSGVQRALFSGISAKN